MENQNDDTNVINSINIYDIDDSQNILWAQKAPFNSIKENLAKRKLKVEGSADELRERLIRYLKGDWLVSDFQKISTMTERIPFCKPSKFSGAIHESVDSFLNKYNRASSINGWTSEQKKSFLVIYLSDTALTFYENFEKTNPSADWNAIETSLRSEFEPIAQTHMLRTLLEKRKQLPDESIASYINEAQNLCKRIDPNMSQSELVHTIMKGLKPNIARYVGILDNNTLDDLKKNIRKYESVEFMLEGTQNQSTNDIKNQITREHVFNVEDIKTKKQLETLTQKISNLETLLNKQNQYNSPNYQNQYNPRPSNYQNQYNSRPSNYQNQYNPRPTNYLNQSNSRPINYQNPRYNNYNKSYHNNDIDKRKNQNQNLNKRFNNSNVPNNAYNTHNKNNYQNNYNNFNKNQNLYNNNRNLGTIEKCKHCSLSNHSSENCKWKLQCSICNKRYHTDENCYSKIQNTKNE